MHEHYTSNKVTVRGFQLLQSNANHFLLDPCPDTGARYLHLPTIINNRNTYPNCLLKGVCMYILLITETSANLGWLLQRARLVYLPLLLLTRGLYGLED